MIHLSAVLAILMLGVAVAETIGPVAGLMPDVRPPGAPVIVSVERTANWQAQALKGISAPQTGLEFLRDQGAWYTPFNQPNMSGRYDIRGLYTGAAGKD
ncbi:MAG: hypothetical protein JNK92_09945 [Dechloromonas sp.]|nr:hypothetical protein [Dechloromonas sp.]